MKKLLTLCLVTLTATIALAQDGRSSWANDMLEAKHQMIIEQVGLTPSQQKQFMPLYETMEREIFQANSDARTKAATVGKKANPSDSEYGQAADALSNAKVKEGEIEARYHEKFAKILSKKQLFLLKQAENNFTRSMLKGKKRAPKRD